MYLLIIPSFFCGWINAAPTESDCFVRELAAPAGHDDLRIYRNRRPCFSAPFPSWPLTIALCTYIVPVLMRLFGRVDVAKLLNCCRSRITPHERRATLFNYRQAASSTLLHPAACTTLLEAVRAWLRLCRAAVSVFHFLFAFIASPRYLIHEVAHPHCSNHHGESSSFPCPIVSTRTASASTPSNRLDAASASRRRGEFPS